MSDTICDFCYGTKREDSAGWIAVGDGVHVCDGCQGRAVSERVSIEQLAYGAYAGFRHDPRIGERMETSDFGDSVRFELEGIAAVLEKATGHVAIDLHGVAFLLTPDTMQVLRVLFDRIQDAQLPANAGVLTFALPT